MALVGWHLPSHWQSGNRGDKQDWASIHFAAGLVLSVEQLRQTAHYYVLGAERQGRQY